MIREQLDRLREHCREHGFDEPNVTELPNGGVLVKIAGVKVEGWNRTTADLIFVAPPGYPAAQPDCFWVEPNGFRLESGATPQAANDGNPIPGDVVVGRSTTWFSWHVQSWNPSRDSLITYFKVVLNRLTPAR